jgi:ribosomal RNA assembly protein
VDLQLESGEYFLSADVKAAKKWEAKKEKQAEKVAENKKKREASFVPPKVSVWIWFWGIPFTTDL